MPSYHQPTTTALQVQYIESLDLKQTCYQTIETLKACLSVLEDPVPEADFSSFELLSNLTKRKLLMDKFNASFTKTVQHVMDLSDFL
jgi:hypothetical protein